MKLKDFLKQFDGLDPEIEIGIGHNAWFITDIHIGKVKIKSSSLFKDSYVFCLENNAKDAIVISQ